jgi:TonB family protein
MGGWRLPFGALALALSACAPHPAMVRSTGYGQLEVTAGAQRGRRAAAFFEELKARVARDWHPDAVALLADPSGALLDGKPHVIAVALSLRANGVLARAELARSSGVPALDAEALDVFHRNQPYPAPPPGMLAEGEARFTIEFRFELERPPDRAAPAPAPPGS